VKPRSLLSRLPVVSVALATLVIGAVSSSAPAGVEVRGRVVISKGGEPKSDHSNAVVYLKGVPGALPDTSGVVHRVYQRNKRFTPAVSVALLGSTIEFPNDDNVFHNVFSLSKALRFDLGLYKSGDKKAVKPRKLGVVDVYCNIHPQMAAKVVVLDTKFYAMTEADGKFRIQGVPPGSYELVAWQPRGKEASQRVVVSPGNQPDLRVNLVESGGKDGHTRKDGTPYGRYE
jgi:plastocyanin